MKTFKQFLLEEIEDEIEDEIKYPKGVYISVNIQEESKIALGSYMEKYLSFYNNLELDDLHCTIIYSAKELKEEVLLKDYKLIANFNRFSKFGDDKNILVIEINSETLVNRNKELTKEYGFVSDYDEYKPHITLSYSVEDLDINSLPPLDFAIYLCDESIEELQEDKDESDEIEFNSDTMVGKALDSMKTKKEKDEKESSKEKKEKKEE